MADVITSLVKGEYLHRSRNNYWERSLQEVTAKVVMSDSDLQERVLFLRNQSCLSLLWVTRDFRVVVRQRVGFSSQSNSMTVPSTFCASGLSIRGGMVGGPSRVQIPRSGFAAQKEVHERLRRLNTNLQH